MWQEHKENTSSAFVFEGKWKTVKGWGGLLDEGPRASVSRQGEPVTRSHMGSQQRNAGGQSERRLCSQAVATVGEEDG